MNSLGIPSTRALSLVIFWRFYLKITSDDLVSRDMFYDGNIKEE